MNVTRKITKLILPSQARGVLCTYTTWQMEIIRSDDVLQASDVQERYRLSFWDVIIVVAAAKGRADVLVTEDLNPGQIIEGVQVSNPFD